MLTFIDDAKAGVQNVKHMPKKTAKLIYILSVNRSIQMEEKHTHTFEEFIRESGVNIELNNRESKTDSH